MKQAGLVSFFFLIFAPSAFGFRLTGQVSSAYYFLQDKTPADSSLNHIRQYQSLSLSATDFGRIGKSKGLELGAMARLRSDFLRGPQKEAQLNFYNLYLGYQGLFGGLDWRLGRQFVAFPMLGTNLDGIFTRMRPARRIEILGFYGAPVNQLSPDRLGPVKENQTWGVSLAASTSPYFRLKVGWGARFFDGKNRFRGGFAEFSYQYRSWSLYGKTLFDRRTNQLARVIAGLTFPKIKNLSARLEAANYKPIFYQNSVFSRLPAARYTDLRAGLDFPLSERLGLFAEPGMVVFNDQSGYRVDVGLRADALTFGYRRTGGLQRNSDGVYSEISYERKSFIFTGSFDVSQFRLSPDTADVADQESRVANLTVGLGWRLPSALVLEAIYQVLSNPDFRYDNRLFFRARWRFEVKK